MNVAAAVLLTLVLVVVPASPASGGAGPPAGQARTDRPAAAASGGPGPGARFVLPVDGAPPPVGVVRGFEPPASRWGAGHRGVDLATAHGAEVRSPGPGTVTFTGDVAGRGVVVVTHGDGLRSSLEPVTSAVPVGARVAAGESVGTVGPAGSGHCAPEACVHWGVRRGERYLDPLSLSRPDRPVVVLLPDG
ncbi:hypothetical protein GCM10028784_15660 [Myceligenerans cantabricum]